MPRKMPALAAALRDEVDRALKLARTGETLRASLLGNPKLSSELSLYRLQLIYEMAFLHIFVHWESFLEASFLRYLCGYANSAGQQTPRAGSYSRSLSAAQATLFGGNRYLLWHGAQAVENRGRIHFISGLHETVVASNRTRMEWFAAVRHHIAHKHADARSNFDNACMNLCGRRFRASRPGAFLRHSTASAGVNRRWLEVIAYEITNVAGQIVP